MVLILALAILLLLSGFFAWAWYDRYFRWIDCFDEQGRCYDSETGMVFVEQAGAIWPAFSFLCLIGALFVLWRILARRIRARSRALRRSAAP